MFTKNDYNKSKIESKYKWHFALEQWGGHWEIWSNDIDAFHKSSDFTFISTVLSKSTLLFELESYIHFENDSKYLLLLGVDQEYKVISFPINIAEILTNNRLKLLNIDNYNIPNHMLKTFVDKYYEAVKDYDIINFDDAPLFYKDYLLFHNGT